MKLPTRSGPNLPDTCSLQEFWDILSKHDWYYMYSDDFTVWRAGERASDKLALLAKQSPEHQKLLEDFRVHHFTGSPWGNEQAPKPPRPTD